MANEEAILVMLKLSDDDMGDPVEDDEPIAQLEDDLEEGVGEAGVGVFDGDEWGGGYCRLFLYGPSADDLLEFMLPKLLAFPARPGSYVIKRSDYCGADEQVLELGTRQRGASLT